MSQPPNRFNALLHMAALKRGRVCASTEAKRLHVPGGGDGQAVRSDLLHLLAQGGGRGSGQGAEAL